MHTKDREYLRQLSQVESCAFDYDDLYAILCEHDSENFDLIVRLAYQLSEMKLNPREARIAAIKVANLATDILLRNMQDVDEQDDKSITSAYETLRNPHEASATP